MPQIAQPENQNPKVIQYPLNDFEPDSIQILRILEQVRAEYAVKPEIREATVNLLRGVGNNDAVQQAKRVVAFVRKSVVYVKDPDNSEYVVSPLRMLQQIKASGYAMGDCDDHVMLLNSMLGSIGIQTKFVGVKYNGSNAFNHVISGVMLNGRMIQVDPCNKNNNPKVYPETLIV